MCDFDDIDYSKFSTNKYVRKFDCNCFQSKKESLIERYGDIDNPKLRFYWRRCKTVTSWKKYRTSQFRASATI